MLHLKRFKHNQGRWTKDSRDVDVPEVITLHGLEYHLIAVAEHSGSYESGHYTALVKMDDRWFSCSDTVVKEVSFCKSFSGRAYIAFFKQP